MCELKSRQITTKACFSLYLIPPQTNISMEVKPIKSFSVFKDTKLGKNWGKLANAQFLHNQTITHKLENQAIVEFLETLELGIQKITLPFLVI